MSVVIKKFLSVCALLAVATPAYAVFDLQITEIWPGNDPGDNLSEDWIEVTNLGDMPWTAATDGDLYFDDESAEPGDAALMSGVLSIAPGESVVFVDDASPADWIFLWSTAFDINDLPQVGTYAGAGLGQGGDGVAIWVSIDPPDGATPLADFEMYPDASPTGGQSWDVPLGAFSVVGNTAGAMATMTVNDMNQPAIGSPGSAIPEPGAMALLILGATTLSICGRRR
jgi:hypothetical protein